MKRSKGYTAGMKKIALAAKLMNQKLGLAINSPVGVTVATKGMKVSNNNLRKIFDLLSS